jgi:hypothetical protein
MVKSKAEPLGRSERPPRRRERPLCGATTRAGGTCQIRAVTSGTPPAHPSLGAPIFFRLALHGWRRRILDLEPMIDSARPKALREYGFSDADIARFLGENDDPKRSARTSDCSYTAAGGTL